MFRRASVLVTLAVLMMIVGTGAYSAAPGYAYFVIFVATALVISNSVFLSSPLHFVDPLRLTGILLFNAFFLLMSMRSSLELRAQIGHFIAFFVFLLSFAAIRLAQAEDLSTQMQSCQRMIRIAAVATLVLLLGAQLAESFGYIEPQLGNRAAADFAIGQRPGGFLNVNMTAAIALALAYIIFEIGNIPTRLTSTLTLFLLCTVVLISQSRAVMLCSGLYVMLLLFRDRLGLGVLATAASLGMAVIALLDEGRLFEVFLDSLATRFGEDDSFNERISQIRTGFGLIAEAPLWGHGYRYLEHLTGRSSHNEVIENAVNFGILGSIVVWASFFLIYRPRSVPLLVACLAPMLFFSHNFFETASLQAVLGMACGITAARKKRDLKPTSVDLRYDEALVDRVT
jgi:O-antigen ligase